MAASAPLVTALLLLALSDGGPRALMGLITAPLLDTVSGAGYKTNKSIKKYKHQ